MGGLQRFEQRLEQAISGVFARTFRSAVQPVEIAAALQRELDNKAQILSRERRLVPNAFDVELSQTDLDRLAPVVYRRPDKVSQLLDAAGELSDRVGGTLRDHGVNMGRMVDGTANAVQVLAWQNRRLPVLMDVLDELFRGLGGLIRVPGPDGTLLGSGVDTFNLDLCTTFTDLCQAP